jgi:uncharacterized membrane protein YfcA
MHSLDIFSLQWFLALAAVFFASLVRGTAGFGLALVLTPILLFVLEPKSVVVVSMILGMLSHIIVIGSAYRDLDLRRILSMTAGSLIGIPLGVVIITIISPSALKILIGAVIVFFAVPLATGFTRTFRREWQIAVVAGFLSGVINSSTSLGGPPVVLFMHNQKWPKEVVHPGLAVYFLFASIFSLLGLLISGLVDIPVVVTAISLAPAMLTGVGIGMLAFRRINEHFFKMLSIAIIFCSGILAILSGLGIFS